MKKIEVNLSSTDVVNLEEDGMEIIKIQRYSSVSYGVAKNDKGRLCFITDVIETLKHILDDDELVRDRVEAFLTEVT